MLKKQSIQFFIFFLLFSEEEENEAFLKLKLSVHLFNLSLSSFLSLMKENTLILAQLDPIPCASL